MYYLDNGVNYFIAYAEGENSGAKGEATVRSQFYKISATLIYIALYYRSSYPWKVVLYVEMKYVPVIPRW